MRVGTDCSGIEAPIQALKNLGIDFIHEFSCDSDKFVRKSIRANYSPKLIYEDITQPRNLPELDLYVAGFPCQTFSTLGNRKGTDDIRGTIFYNCVDTIKKTKPKIFVLENVQGLLSFNGGSFFKDIMKTLEDLEIYEITFNKANTKDFGIPQNRVRIFFIGLAKNLRNTKKFNLTKNLVTPTPSLFETQFKI